MKTLYSFFASILTILLIAGCSDSSSASSDPYPIQVGAFTVQSESQAEWTGMPPTIKMATAAAIGDTLRYARPDSLSMIIDTPSQSDTSDFVIVIDDSTLHFEDFQNGNIDGQRIKIDNSGEESPITLHNGAAGNSDGGFMNVQFHGNYDCSSAGSIAETSTMTYSLLIDEDPDNPYRTYILETPGFQQVLNHLVCHEAL